MHGARAKVTKGEAESKVTAAKHATLGRNKENYLAEIQRDTAKSI
jgi:hypothetical protein